MDYLNTEISTSKQKKFSLVTFIDTPGLVDGDMKYPFDVNQSMLWLGKSLKITITISLPYVPDYILNDISHTQVICVT